MTQPFSSTLKSRSVAVSHSATTVLCPAVSWRYFLLISNCDATNGIWVNLAGGTAAANTLDCIFIDKLTTFKLDGSAVTSGKIQALAVAADVNVTCLVMENP